MESLETAMILKLAPANAILVIGYLEINYMPIYP